MEICRYIPIASQRLPKVSFKRYIYIEIYLEIHKEYATFNDTQGLSL